MLTAAIACFLCVAPPLTHLGTHESGVHDRSACEIAAHHPRTQTLWVVNGTAGIDVIDIHDPSRPTKVATHPMPAPTSVAIHGDLVAVAVPDPQGGPGNVRFLDASGAALATVAVGHGPDMCTFTPDGSRLVVANEGEMGEAGDPEGSISIVDLAQGPGSARVRTIGFASFERDRARLAAEGAHLPVPGREVHRQLEPEYVSVTPDGRTAIVGIQEASAIAIVDLERAEVTALHGLPMKDFARSGLDGSSKDGPGKVRPADVLGLRQPDAVVSWSDGTDTWFALSEEGEWREGPAFDERAKVRDVRSVGADDPLADLVVSRPASDRDGDGTAERLVCFGGRGVSIWRMAPTGCELAWDSGDQVERAVASGFPEIAAASDARSTSRGPEPEGLALGEVGGRRMLFAGLERTGGIMAWDVTDPRSPVVLGCVHRRDPARDPSKELSAAGDLGPEGLLFIPAASSPNGRPMLAVCNEVSGTVSLWDVNAPGAAARTVSIKAIPGAMKYDVTEIKAVPGEVLHITLENPDTMQHNLLIVMPGKLTEVGVAGDKMGETAEGKAKQFVPDLPSVIAVMGMVDPGKTGSLRWTVPSKPGTYPYVCTYPGHWRMMNGKIKVTAPAK